MGRLIDVARYAAGVRSQQLQREMMNFQRDINREVNQIVKKLDKLPEQFTKRRRNILLRKASKIFVSTVQANVPISDRPHKRYNQDGKVVATYLPKNLYNSIQSMKFRKSDAVFVGPKITRKKLSVYGASTKTTDPYYAWMVENGTKHIAPRSYMRKGFESGKFLALHALREGVERIVKQYERKYGKK